jgi:very-short-patch-repair endonuclease
MGLHPIIPIGPQAQWPTYEPPYDSPIEDIFAYHLDKYLPPDAIVNRQVEVTTQCGTFRIDFVCDAGERTVAFECDGAQYHDKARDEWRDALIMASGRVNALYRIMGQHILHQIDRAMYLISRSERNLFSARGRRNLQVLGERGHDLSRSI